MANLKLDLINHLNLRKYYAELELVRLAQDPNMNYENKIESMSYSLKEIAILNAQLGGVEQYFKEEPQQQGSAIPQQENPNGATPIVHQGQSHGE